MIYWNTYCYKVRIIIIYRKKYIGAKKTFFPSFKFFIFEAMMKIINVTISSDVLNLK